MATDSREEVSEPHRAAALAAWRYLSERGSAYDAESMFRDAPEIWEQYLQSYMEMLQVASAAWLDAGGPTGHGPGLSWLLRKLRPWRGRVFASTRQGQASEQA